MKPINVYIVALFTIMSLLFTIGCKKEQFVISNSTVLRDGTSWDAEVRASISDDGVIGIGFVGQEDEGTHRLGINIPRIFQGAFRYDFGQSDEGIVINPTLFATVGDDAICDTYVLDTEVPTNFFEVEHFSLEDCTIRGSYDLTFRLDEDQTGTGCQNPTYGPIIRFSEGSFETRIEGCE